MGSKHIMASNKEDNIPLVAVKPHKSNYFRATSCFDEPETSALNFVLTNDETGLSDLLAEVCPLSDDSKKSNHVNTTFPMPDSHWINKPQGTEYQKKTLLHLAIDKGNLGMIKLLLTAGAKADAYNDILGKCPIHIATELESKNILVVLLSAIQGNKANVDTLDQSGRTALHLACEKGNM